MSRQSEYYYPRFPSLLVLLFSASFIILLPSAAICTGRQEQLPTLQSGQTIERQLRGGETHIIQVAVAKGQYLCVAVEQRGIDIELKLASPNKQILIETDALNSTQGPEIAALIATQTGLHRIEIVSPNKSSPTGMYEVKILAQRLPTEQDRLWLAAQRFYVEGKQLSDQPTAAAQEQSVQKFADALRIWQVLEDRLMVTHTLYYLVSVYRNIGQTQHALVYSGYALELLRAIKQPREEAEALTTLANVFSELGELRKALEYYEQSLAQWRSFKDTNGEARTLINLGLVNSQLGEMHVALDNYDQALAVWTKLRNHFQAAETLTRIGLAYDNLGEWQKSLEYTTQALAQYRTIGNKRGEAAAVNNTGLVYVKLGEAQKALDYYNQSLTLWRTLGNRREEANTLSNIGLAEAQQNNSTKALASYQLSLKLWREAGDRRGEALVLQRLGDLQAAASDHATALEFYNQALPLFQTAGDIFRESSVLMGIGNLQLAQGDPNQAKENFNRALTILQAIGHRANEAQALYGLARTERAQGNLNKAHQQIELALTKAEAVRTEVGSQQLRASYLASIHKYYELNLEILMQLHQAHPDEGYDARAIQASEHARARGLVELLAEAHANIRAGVETALLESSEKLQQQLNVKAQRQLQLTAKRGNEAQLKELRQEISGLEDEYNQVEATIRKTSPRYAALTQPQPLNLKEIQQQLDENSLLLEYSLGEERSWLWAITKNSSASFALPKRGEIEQAALQVRDLLIVRSQNQRGETARQREARIAQADTQFPEIAGALSQMILSPVASMLGNHQLIVVADGALQYVPFAVLPEPWSLGLGLRSLLKTDDLSAKIKAQKPKPKDQPLIVAHEIISLPSASTLTVLRREIAGRQPAPKMLAVFADPVFTLEDARLRSSTIKTKSKAVATNEIVRARSIVHEEEKTAANLAATSLTIQPLPFTRQEANQILAFVPEADSFKATGFAATRAAALNPALSQYRYLHFATHGLIDNERPGLSSLVLSLVDEAGKPQHGFLRAHEIYNLKFPAELVVLSACQTGLGKEVKGEGLMGLTRGFMYTGAARVVVSLWSVNDKATSELMTIFYRQMLKENQRPAAALRTAQIEMWKQKQWQAPYYWAAFVLQGEWR